MLVLSECQCHNYGLKIFFTKKISHGRHKNYELSSQDDSGEVFQILLKIVVPNVGFITIGLVAPLCKMQKYRFPDLNCNFPGFAIALLQFSIIKIRTVSH